MENFKDLKEGIGDYSLRDFNPEMSFSEQVETLRDEDKFYEWLKSDYGCWNLVEASCRWLIKRFSSNEGAIKSLEDGYYLTGEDKESVIKEWCHWAITTNPNFSWLNVYDPKDLMEDDEIRLYRTIDVDSKEDIILDGDNIGGCWTSDKETVTHIDGYQEGDCTVYIVADVKLGGVNLLSSYIYHIAYEEAEVNVFDRDAIELIGIYDVDWNEVDLDGDEQLPPYSSEINQETYNSL